MKMMYNTAIIIYGVAIWTDNLEKWEDIFQSGKSRGILNRLETSGKAKENHTKYWKAQGISDKYFLLFLVICE